MWLLQYRKAPDHTTISRFLENNMSGCADELFYQLIEKLAKMGEINFNALFVDGTKIEANANKYSFVWRNAVEKHQRKLNEKIGNELTAICEKHGVDCGIGLERAAERGRNSSTV